jgi:hypothetical protein
LGNIFLNSTFIIGVLFLFFNLVHGQLELMDDCLVKNLVYETVGLRKLVLEIRGVADLPGKEVVCGHGLNILQDELNV